MIPGQSAAAKRERSPGIRRAPVYIRCAEWSRYVWQDALTVLCYHRIGWPNDPEVSGFQPNVSATPEAFREHLDLLARYCSPVSLASIEGWLDGKAALPPRPVLVTFDDGYRDVKTTAWPLLKARGIPAVVFLATRYVGSKRPYLCDWAHYCFANTLHDHAVVPLLGAIRMNGIAEKQQMAAAWIERAKQLPQSACDALREDLAQSLRVSPEVGVSGSGCLDWDEVRELSRDGLDFGAHTRNHAILSRLNDTELEDEVRGSFEDMAAQLQSDPLAFAYPNGATGDFGARDETGVRDAGFRLAFSTRGGPQILSSVRRRPHSIRRIVVSSKDDLKRFSAKLAGATWLSRLCR